MLVLVPQPGQEIPMTGVPVQPVYPYPQDPKAGPAPPQPGFMYPPSGPAPQYPLYPAGPPVYNPAGEWAPPPACSALGVLQPGSRPPVPPGSLPHLLGLQLLPRTCHPSPPTLEPEEPAASLLSLRRLSLCPAPRVGRGICSPGPRPSRTLRPSGNGAPGRRNRS